MQFTRRAFTQAAASAAFLAAAPGARAAGPSDAKTLRFIAHKPARPAASA